MTTARQTSEKVFHGWWVVLVAGVGLSLSYARSLSELLACS